MAADKKISELPSTNQLSGGVLAMERPNAPMTNKITVDLLIQYVAQQIGVGGQPRLGNDIPTAPFGNNKDIYFRSNGEIYYKTNGAWGLLGAIQTGGGVVSYTSTSPQVAILADDIQVIFEQPYQLVTGVQVVSGDITYEGFSKQYQTGGGAINGMLIIGAGSVPIPFRVDFIGQ